MFNIAKKYSVYVHIFPDGRKYVGYTGRPVKTRWDGGMGYVDCPVMFDAIVKTGWNNINHYVLLSNTDKKTAMLMEAALIKKWKTYKRYRGHNVRVPDVDGVESFVIPPYKKKRIEDKRDADVGERFENIVKRRRLAPCNNCKRVRIVETGEEFDGVQAAAEAMFVTTSALYNVVGKPNRTCGTCVITDPDEGWTMEVRAHWVYVD